MTNLDPDSLANNFSGCAPLFPLPNVVTYPHVILPLHVFEPRYRAMVADALQGERLVAMALLKPGWEPTYHEKTPEIFETVCLGSIIAHERLDNGCYNLALQGLSRGLVLSEDHDDLPYRFGTLKVVGDHYPRQPIINRAHRRRELLSGLRELAGQLDLDQILPQVVESQDVPLGQLCDVIAHAMRLPLSTARQILAQVDADQRSDIVLQCLREKVRGASGVARSHSFPPHFSRN